MARCRNCDKRVKLDRAPQPPRQLPRGFPVWHAYCCFPFVPRNAPGNPKEGKMINLTPSAADAIRSAIARADDAPAGLRIQVDAGGCAGFKYLMGLVSGSQPGDTVVEVGDVAVFIDEASHPMLAGTTVDFVVALEGSGFTFDNPNAERSCSCGKSFG